MALDILIGIGVAALFVAVFCWDFWLMSILSGWSDLAQRFRYRGKFKGKMYRFRKLGPSRWKVWGDAAGIGTLNAGMNEEGLYMVPCAIARLFHPPLLIPWNELDAVPEGKFFFKYRVSVRSVPDVALYFGDWFYGAAGYLTDLKSPYEDLVSR